MLSGLKSVSKDSAFYSIANLMNKIVGFILLPVYSSCFIIEEYGLLALFDTIFDFMNIFASFGMIEAFKRWYWEKDDVERQKTIFTNTVLFSLFSAVFFGLILNFLMQNFSVDIFGREFSNRFIWIYLLSIVANIVMQRVFLLLQTKRLAAVNMVYNIIRASVTCLITVVLIVHFKMGIESVFLARLLGFSFTLVLLLPRIIKNLNWRINFRLLHEMFKFSYPLAISGSLSMIFTLSDRWLLKGLSSLENVGQYSLAYRVTNLIKFLVINSFIQAYVYTFFQKMHNPEHYKFYKRIVTYFFLAVMSIGLILIAYSREIIRILAKSPDYRAAYTIIPILMIAILFSGLRRIFVLPFYKYKHTKYISVVSVTAGILNILMNVVLIPYYGSYGAAAATALAHIFVVFAYYYKSRKFKEFSYETGRFVIIFFSAIIYIIFILYLNGLPLLTGIICKTLLLVSYPFLLHLYGFYKPKELQMIKKALRKPFRKKTL